MTMQEAHLDSNDVARETTRDNGNGQAMDLWLDQAMFLCGQGRTVTPELRLAHYRAQRDTQQLHKDACFYSIAFVITEIAENRISKADADCDTVPTPHEDFLASQEPLSNDSSSLLDAPETPSQENAVRSKASNAIVTATFREYGEHEMAKLFANEPKEFKRRVDNGLRYLRGAGTHVHSWKLVNPYAFGGPVFVCRKCNKQMEQKD